MRRPTYFHAVQRLQKGTQQFSFGGLTRLVQNQDRNSLEQQSRQEDAQKNQANSTFEGCDESFEHIGYNAKIRCGPVKPTRRYERTR